MRVDLKSPVLTLSCNTAAHQILAGVQARSGAEQCPVRAVGYEDFACSTLHPVHTRSIVSMSQVSVPLPGPGGLSELVVLSGGGDGRLALYRARDGRVLHVGKVANSGDLYSLLGIVLQDAHNGHLLVIAGTKNTSVMVLAFPLTEVQSALQRVSDDSPQPSLYHTAAAYKGHFGFVYALAQCDHAGGPPCVVSGSGDGTVLFWRLASAWPESGVAGLLRLHARRTGHSGSVYCAHGWAGRIFTGSQDASIRVWDADSGAGQHVLAGHEDSVLSICHVQRPQHPVLVSACAAGTLRLWCLATFAPLAVVREAHGSCAHVLSTRSGPAAGQFVSGGTDGALRLWETDILLGRPGSDGAQSAIGAAATDLGPIATAAPAAASGVGALSKPGQLQHSTSVSSLAELMTAASDKRGAHHSHEPARPPPGSPTPQPPLPVAQASPGVTSRTHGDMSQWAGRQGPGLPAALVYTQTAGESPVQVDTLAVEGGAGSPGSPPSPPKHVSATTPTSTPAVSKPDLDLSPQGLVALLRDFVGIRSVSSNPTLRPQCWEAARFMRGVLTSIGAEVRLVQVVAGTNPVVLGRLGRTPGVPTITVHGHYDVQPGDSEGGGHGGWDSEPFTLSGRDGFLYGRGASDNKGPLLAAVFAAAKVFHARDAAEAGASEATPTPNFVFLVEGEGENGSDGFREAVQWNQDWFEGTSLVLNTNNVWMDDEHPCLTFGMRGVVKVRATVTCPHSATDRHAGTDGGVMQPEPLMDLCAAMASLLDPKTGEVAVPGFTADVATPSDVERAAYADAEAAVGGAQGTALLRRWVRPALTVHHITSSSANDTVIPRSAAAVVSVRTVPDQQPAELAAALVKHLLHSHAGRPGSNVMQVQVVSAADWWLADPESAHYRAAAAAIEAVWGKRPLLVREGGTMRVTPFLEKALGAPAMHLPIGQASDGAHQVNERIRLTNLVNGMEVLTRMFQLLAGEVGADTAKPARAMAEAL